MKAIPAAFVEQQLPCNDVTAVAVYQARYDISRTYIYILYIYKIVEKDEQGGSTYP